MRIGKSHMAIPNVHLDCSIEKTHLMMGHIKNSKLFVIVGGCAPSFSLPEPKVQASSSDHPLSVVRPSVTISHF